jgi:hypothetical protein
MTVRARPGTEIWPNTTTPQNPFSQPFFLSHMTARIRDPAICPLLLVGRSYASEVCPSIGPSTFRQLDDLLSAFISGHLDYQRAVQHCINLIGCSRPIDRLSLVLTVGDQPLPSVCSMSLSNGNCFVRKPSESWSEYEDIRLLAGIHKFGLESWGSIARFVGNSRTKAQCSQRWIRGLDPRLSKSQWSSAEDQRLRALVEQYGEKSWTRIAVEFGNRCDVQCRYRFRQLKESHFDTTSSPDTPVQSIPAHGSAAPAKAKMQLPPILSLIASSSSLPNVHLGDKDRETPPNELCSVITTCAVPPASD